MQKQKKIKAAVTGASGFIGSKLIPFLLKNNFEVTAIVRKPISLPPGCVVALCDILDYESLSETVSRSDIVFHLAGIVGVNPCENDVYKTVDVNINGTLNVLDSAKYFNKPMIFASVSNVNDYTIYSISKATSERFVMMYNKEHKTNFIPVRIYNVYGPNQDLKSGKLIINGIIRGLKGKPISIYGEGSQIMDFIYMDDVVTQLLSLANMMLFDFKFNKNKVFEIGTGKGTSIIEAAKVIVNATGNKSKIIFKPKRDGDKMMKLVAHRNNLVTNTIKVTNFEEGIIKTTKEIRKHL